MPYADNNAIYISAQSLFDADAERSFDRPCSVMVDDVRRYFMRARNTALSSYVYWYVDGAPDITGYSSGYPPANLADITVMGIEEAPVNGQYTSEQRFTSYQDLVTYLSTRTSAYKEVLPLYKKGYAGDPNYVIGNWQWSNDLAPVITPVGPVRFDLVTDGGYGVVLSVDGPTTLTLVGGHTLGSVGYVLAWDTSAGVELLARSSFTRVVDSVTVSSTTGMAAGDQIYQLDTSEFVIGGSTRDVRLEANTTCRFSSGLVLTGRAVLGLAGIYKRSRMVATISSYTPLSASGKRVLVGWQLSTGLNRGGGFSRGAAPTLFGAYEEDTVLTTSASAVVSAASVIMSCYSRSGGNDGYIPGVDSSAYVGGTMVPYATYATAIPYLCADDGAVFSGLNSDPTASAGVAYTSYDEVVAFLTLQGNTHKQAVPLYKKGYAGNPAYIIGHWKWTSDAVPVIAPAGEIRLDLVTNSQYAIVASRDSGTQATLEGGHNLVSGLCRLFDTSGAVEFGDQVCTVAVNTLTGVMPAALAAGDQIWIVGGTEFSVGSVAAARNVRILSGFVKFSGGLLVTNGRARAYLGYGKRPVRCSITATRTAAADGQYAGAGYGWGANSLAPCIGRVGGSNYSRMAYGSPSAPAISGTMIGGLSDFSVPVDLVATEYGALANELVANFMRGDQVECLVYTTGGGVYGAAVPDSFVAHANPVGAETVTCLLTAARML